MSLPYLIAIVGGRVIPAFHRQRREGFKPSLLTRSVEVVSVGALVVILASLVSSRRGCRSQTVCGLLILVVAAVGQLVAFAALAATSCALGNPLLWMLPVAYAWLPISLALRALELQAIIPSGAASPRVHSRGDHISDDRDDDAKRIGSFRAAVGCRAGGDRGLRLIAVVCHRARTCSTNHAGCLPRGYDRCRLIVDLGVCRVSDALLADPDAASH